MNDFDNNSDFIIPIPGIVVGIKILDDDVGDGILDSDDSFLAFFFFKKKKIIIKKFTFRSCFLRFNTWN